MSALITRAAIVLTALMVTTAAIAAPGSRPTREFVEAAGQSDSFEMMEATTALAESRDPQVLAFASMLLRDHLVTSRAITDAAQRAGLEAPTPGALGGDQSQFLGALQSLRGIDFDRTFWKQQMLAHTAALATENAYAATGDTPALRAAARGAIPAIQAHLAMATRMVRSDPWLIPAHLPRAGHFYIRLAPMAAVDVLDQRRDGFWTVGLCLQSADCRWAALRQREVGSGR